jgi:hypothetical protein
MFTVHMFVSPARPYNVGYNMHLTKLSPNQFIGIGGGGE